MSLVEYKKAGQKKNSFQYTYVIAELQGLINIKLKNYVFSNGEADHGKAHVEEKRMREIIKLKRKADHEGNWATLSSRQRRALRCIPEIVALLI